MPHPRHRTSARRRTTGAAAAVLVLLATLGVAAPPPAAGLVTVHDDVLGLRVAHPGGWQVTRDPVGFATYGMRLAAPVPGGDGDLVSKARVAVHPGSAAAGLERIVTDLRRAYPATPMTRRPIRLAGGTLHGVAIGPVPGALASTNVYFTAHDRVYQIDLYTDGPDAAVARGAISPEAASILDRLRLGQIRRTVASLGLTPAASAVRQGGAVPPLTRKQVAAARGQAAPGTGTPGIAAAEYQLADGCWTQPSALFIQTSHGPYANSSTAYPGWSRMGTPNFWGERTHGNLGLGRCTSTYYTNDMYAIDYYLDTGDALYSPFAAGYVTYAGWDPGNWWDYGVMVVIQAANGKHWSLSAHLYSVNVSAGQYVTDEALIGWADSTGYADPYPHLHQAFYRYAQSSYGRPYGGQGMRQTELTHLGDGGGVYRSFAKNKWVSW